MKPGGALDKAALGFSVVVRSMPPFVIGILLTIVFAVTLQWLPAAGHTQQGTIVLPALTMALALAAVSSRVARTAAVEVARSDYFRFALTKGLPFRRAVRLHALRNIGVPVVAHLGIQLVYLVEGVVVVETLFAWPGIGHALGHAVLDRDVPMAQGATLALALFFVVLNLLLDLALVAIDPRLRKRS